MPPQTTLQVRVSTKDRDAAKRILADLGLNLSGAVTVYLKQIIRTRKLPFVPGGDDAAANEMPNRSTALNISSSLHELRLGKLQPYTDSTSAIAHLRSI